MTVPQTAEDWTGRTAERELEITAAMVDQFADVSGDRSPIHMQDAAARQRGFQARVVHGMLLAGLAVAMIGMELPGEAGVIQDLKFDFRNPCHPGDTVRIEIRVVEFFESVQTLVLKIRIVRSDGTLLANGQVQSGLRAVIG